MKVQLVTHSIIPNLNSGLVPIDPVGLVPPTKTFSIVLAWHSTLVVPKGSELYLYQCLNFGPSNCLTKVSDVICAKE